MSLRESSLFQQITGDLNHEVFLTINCTSISSFSIIIECLNSSNQPVSFPPNKTYCVEVSNNGYDEPDPDPYSYYNVIIEPDDGK